MKFELVIDGGAVNYHETSWMLTVSRTEFFECYNRNKDFCLAELNYMIKMYCVANHFDRQLTELELEKLAKDCKPYCDFIAFDIENGKNGKPKLGVGYFENSEIKKNERKN